MSKKLFLLISLLPTLVCAAPSTHTVKTQLLASKRLFTANIEAVHQTTVSAQTSGRIIEINFDIDNYVEKNDILLRFSDKEQLSRLNSAKSSVKEMQANLEQAEKEYTRIKNIYAKKLVAKSTLDKAQATLKSSRARASAALSKMSEAKEQWEHTVVRAPYSGIVVKRFVQVGETAQPGLPLMTGISLEHLRAVINIPQDLISIARKNPQMHALIGQKIYPIKAADITISPYADTQTHTFNTRLQLPTGLSDLYPGMSIKVSMQTGEHNQIMIPVSALVIRSEVNAVYIQNSDNSVSFRQVRVGRKHNGKIQILSGLRDGDKVFIDPLKALVLLKSQPDR